MDSGLGNTVEWLGVTYKTILATDTTGGKMSITDSVSPAGSGPPRHIHHREDETFFILSGDCEFWMAGSSKIIGEGRTMFIPRGVEHTFKVTSDCPCRHLIILTPGGFEGFFTEMARGQFQIPADMNRIVEIAARFNLTFTGPPL
jgi:quercetin dioxygenase-like cupin family protein